LSLEYDESIDRGLAHVVGHAESYEARMQEILRFIDTKTGNPEGCVYSLNSHAEARCMSAWFGDRDLTKFKHWAYLAAKLYSIIKIMHGNAGGSFSVPSSTLLYPLISDNEAILNSYVSYDAGYYANDIENTRTGTFHDYQAVLALRGEWKRLAERCERILADPPKRRNKFIVDFHFYLALAQGNRVGMETALQELTSPKMARKRNHDGDMGYTEYFIGTDAVVFAKIAWRSGYELQIDTPFIPKEWLPVEPLTTYEDPYRFMSQY